MNHFKGSLIFTVVCLFLAGLTGYLESGALTAALGMVFIAAVLGVMETSLSLDNAVVNATVLKDMDEKWQQRFLTWGIAIAVFGMRIVFPLAIVSIAAWVSPWEAIKIAIGDHARYEQIVTSAHIGIAGFGGAFLLLVGLTFFFDEEKEHHWLHWIEQPMMLIGKLPLAPYIIASITGTAIAFYLPAADGSEFAKAYSLGMFSYALVNLVGDFLGGDTDATGKVVRAGIGGFIYLEFLDASFSFDGVIGAFAITNDIVIIALGLGIGAMFVRSMTVFLVKGGHLDEYRYLEHGAFYAIMALAAIMLLGTTIHTPEVVTGLIGAALIGASYWSSVRYRNKRTLSPEWS